MEDFMSRCVSGSTEYAAVIISTRSPDQPVYLYPFNGTVAFTVPYPIANFQVLSYPNCKVAIDLLYPNYYLAIIIPTVSDTIISSIFKEALFWIKNIYPFPDNFPCVTDELISERTPRSGRSGRMSQRDLMTLKLDMNDKLRKALDPVFICLFYRVYPFILYEDEDFSTSPIIYPQVCLPLAIGCNSLALPVSVEVRMEIQSSLNLLYLDKTVIVHEILTLDSPSAVINSVMFMYRGCIITGNLPESDIREVMKLYYANTLFIRTNTFPQFTLTNKIKNGKQEKVFALIAVKAGVLCLVLQALTDGTVEYDPWFVEKGLRVCKEMDDKGIFEKLEEEYQKKIIKPEISEHKERFSRAAELQVIRKSRSVASSPIGSPKSVTDEKETKKYQPTYLPEHDIEVYHYVLADYKTKRLTVSPIKGSKEWYLNVIRLLFCHYSNLYEIMQANPNLEYHEINVNFDRILDSQQVAACRYSNTILFLHYIGDPVNLKQFAFQLSQN